MAAGWPSSAACWAWRWRSRLGLLIYRGALRVNLATFFKWTGIALIVIAAGVFTYGIHELQEAGLLFGEDSIAFDISGAFPETSAQYALFRGLFAVRTVPSWLEVFAWFAYLVPTMWLFLRTIRRPVKSAAGSGEGRRLTSPFTCGPDRSIALRGDDSEEDAWHGCCS